MPPETGPETLGEYLSYLAPSLGDKPEPPSWPPDLFALVGSVLLRTGAYRAVIKKPFDPVWVKTIDQIGGEWQESWEQTAPAPAAIRADWQTIWANRKLPMKQVTGKPVLCDALLRLSSIADRACLGIGLLHKQASRLHSEAEKCLLVTAPGDGGSTMCHEISPWKIRVLPKLHTPQKGLTFRSLTHYLALCPSEEVVPRWLALPRASQPGLVDTKMFNILVLPWPRETRRSQFKSAGSTDLPDGFGYFAFEKKPLSASIAFELQRALDKALVESERIHLIVLPELALTQGEYEEARTWAKGIGVPLISGVGTSPLENGPGANYVAMDFPFPRAAETGGGISVRQSKHHRWRLDRGQIEAYGLGNQLDVGKLWWEHIAIDDRALHFISVIADFTLCVLVCEDLAQQEPAATLIRAIGPNLVIAVLMDGPQLKTRWPARYATVLADDPGSSVLTVSSLGMVECSRPPGVPASRVVALWKDAKTGSAHEIDLGHGASGIVLNLRLEMDTEWTADGRSDKASMGGYPVLVGCYNVKGSA